MLRLNKTNDLSDKLYLQFVYGLLKIFILVTIILLTMASKTTSEGIKNNAEYTIEVEWPSLTDNDVDTWLKTPSGGIVWYQNKNVGLVNLDRDDTGILNDRQIVNGISTVNPHNEEVVSIRGIVAGDYVLTMMLFRNNATEYTLSETGQLLTGETHPLADLNPGSPIYAPIPVTITIKKLNPIVTQIFTATLDFTKIREEVYICSFTIKSDGSVEVHTDLPEYLVGKSTMTH